MTVHATDVAGPAWGVVVIAAGPVGDDVPDRRALRARQLLRSAAALRKPCRCGTTRAADRRSDHHSSPAPSRLRFLAWEDDRQAACLDSLTVDDLDTAEHDAVRLGATKEHHQPNPERSRVLRDLAGHPFCLRV